MTFTRHLALGLALNAVLVGLLAVWAGGQQW